MKDYVFEMINICLIKGNYTLTEFQREILDAAEIDSSIEYGDEDKEIKMEIWKDDDEDFYIVIDTKGNLLKSYN